MEALKTPASSSQGEGAFPIGLVSEIQALENQLIHEWGYPASLLIERAALVVARFIEANFSGAPVLVIAGVGNNGADGLALARLLVDRGFTVRVLTTGAGLGPEATLQLGWLGRRGLNARHFTGAERFGSEWVAVDAIFGIGLNRALSGEQQLAVQWLNSKRWRSLVSLDTPSGLDADKGAVRGTAVRAGHTICCGALKPGLLADGALAFVGKLWLADSGFPSMLSGPFKGRLNSPAPLPGVLLDAHKGSLGTVLILAGQPPMSGAAVLAARAACRSGAGLVYVAVARSQRELVALAVPEAIVLPLGEGPAGPGPEAMEVLSAYLPRLKSIAIGPGLGRAEGMRELVSRLLEAYEGPVVLDADALPRGDERLPARRGLTVLTPHAGELGRMLDAESEAIQGDRLGSALRAARLHESIVVFKGARTVIARPEGDYALNATGNALLATAGSGDVLTGLIAGLLARGMEPYDAARSGVYWHGRAADAAAGEGMVSLVASDIIDRLPWALGQKPEGLVGDIHFIH